jgi:hypothetical protein
MSVPLKLKFQNDPNRYRADKVRINWYTITDNLFYTEISDEGAIKNGVFWVVTPCGSCKNRRLGGTWRLLHQGDKNR